MKFNEILFDIIVENFANKKLLQILLNKWFGETPTDQDKEFGELLAIEFYKIRPRLNETNPSVRTFFNRYPDFNKNNLQDISKYDKDQIIFIITEFVDIDIRTNPEIPEIFVGRNLRATDERINASKDLWYSKPSNLIVDEEGFRVYSIKNKKQSQMWGYYHGFLLSQAPFVNRGWSLWCVTRPDETSNLYGSYRTGRHKRTFYFVIDESKNPETQPNPDISQYYISALQTAYDSTTGFKITTIQNNGVDVDITEETLYSIYPKLRGHFDKIKPIEFKEDELGEILDDLDRVNEDENNPYAFWKISTALKKRYIDARKPISNPKSWDTMNPGLKQSYFDLTTEINYLERFSNFDILNHIKNDNQDKRSLITRLERLGLRLGNITDNLMKSQFDNIRISVDNPNFSVYQSKRDGKVGIFDSLNGDWLVKDGKTYDNRYDDLTDQGKGDVYTDKTTGVGYAVEPFCDGVRNNVESDDCFYVLYSLNDSSDADGYFLSNRKWMELSKILTPENPENEVGQQPEDDIAQNRSTHPKDYADIKEKWGL